MVFKLKINFKKIIKSKEKNFLGIILQIKKYTIFELL